MNAQVQPAPSVSLTFTVSLTAAETLLEGLEHLPIRRAGVLHAALQEEIDKAKARAIAPKAPAPLAPPADPPQPPQENTQQ